MITYPELNNLLDYLADNGFTFIRIKPNDKRPEGKWKNPEDRINAEQVIERLQFGGNYGIIPPEGCFIIDFDSDEAYQRSIGKDASIKESLTFKTPRGYHVLFQGEGIAQGASHTYLGQGVDVRAGNRGYVVGPGSTREGGEYDYHSGEPIIEVPESLRKLLQKPEPVPAKGKAGTPPQSPVAPSSEQPEGMRSLSVTERGKAAKKHWDILKATDETVEGNRNDTLSAAATGLGSIYADAEPEKRNEIFAKLIEHAERLGNGDQAEIKQNITTATNQWKKGAESPATRPDGTKAREIYRMIFEKFDIHEFERALDNLKIKIRDNQETDKVEFLITDDGTWPITQGFRFKVGEWFIADKKTINALIGNITRYFGRQRGESIVSVSLPETKFNVWRDTIAGENPIRPFRYWVEHPPAIIIREDLTLENWLNVWLVNKDSDLNRWIARAIMIGIMQKIYRNKQACRIIPVLRGDKGIGKTTLVTELIPEEFRCMFGQFQVNSRKNEMVNALRGKFLCEAGELAGMNDSRVSIFKAFIGNEMNTARMPYESEFMDYENTAFIIGTTNPERNVPNDDALRSRLVFVDLEKGPDPKEYIPDIRTQLYVMARDEYLKDKQGVGVLPEELEAEQYLASEDSIIVNEVMEESINTMDLRLIPEDYFLLRDALFAARLISRTNTRQPAGATKAMKEHLSKLGVGLKRKDKKHINGIGYYVMSETMKQIRANQLKELGEVKFDFDFQGRKINHKTEDLSGLD